MKKIEPSKTGSTSDRHEWGESTLCSICIATYRRPHLLQKLIISLANQELPPGVKMEVILVDNDSHRSAAPIFQEFKHFPQMDLYYLNQPKKNISLSRNMGVKKASGEYILFIDDDETASPQWVFNLLKSMKEFKVDGAFGPVMPEFNKQTPKWMRHRDLFYGPLQSTGETPKHKWSGNCMIRASLLKTMEEPFDPVYGNTGGEDTHLFERLERQGALFVYCREAQVSEYLPPDRTRTSYLLRRSLKGGDAHTRRAIEFTDQFNSLFRLLIVGKALSYGITSFFFAILLYPSKFHRTQWLMKFTSNAGRFLAAFGIHYRMYK